MNNKRHLFRGFHPDENGKTTITLNGDKINGEWIYWNVYGVCTKMYITMVHLGSTQDIFEGEVIPETIGQSVTTDKYKDDIFEGDFIGFHFAGTYYICEVVYIAKELRYAAKCDKGDFEILDGIEKVGNKWEGVSMQSHCYLDK